MVVYQEFSRPKHSHKRRFFKRGEEAEPEAPENAYQLQTHLFGDDYEGAFFLPHFDELLSSFLA